MSPGKRLLSRGSVRLGLTLVIVLGWFAISDLNWPALRASLARMSPSVLVSVPALISANLAVGAVRWGILMRAFGQPHPGWSRTLHAYFVAGFYNTFLPANLGGDLMRAAAAGTALPSRSTAYWLVLIERVLGFSGLFLLAGMTAAYSRSAPSAYWIVLLAAGSACLALALATSPLSHWLLARLPEPLSQRVSALPRLKSWPRLLAVTALSVLTQALFTAGALLLVLDVATVTSIWAVFSALVLALLAIFLPTFAGFGSREVAFSIALGQFGIDESQATAASLSFGLAQVAVACVGGLLHAARSLK